MPTSTFNLDIGSLVEEAYERAGLESKSGYDLRTARRSLNLLFLEWANRQINLWTVEQGTLPLTAGVANYTLPADTIDVLDAAIRTGSGLTQNDIVIERRSYSDYLSIPNKTAQGMPVQYTILRGATAPTLLPWLVPDSNGPYTFVYYRMRRIYDIGTIDDDVDTPARFVPAVVAGLAYMIAMKRPEVADRIPMLKAMYDEQLTYAMQEDRDRSPLRLVPGGMYQ